MRARTALVIVGVAALAGCSSSTSPASAPSSRPSVASSPASSSPVPPSPVAASPGAAAPVSSPAGSSAGLSPADAPAPGPVLAALPLAGTAAFGDGVSARVTGSKAVTSQGQGVGQVAGAPAVAVTVEVRNGSSVPVALGLANVTASYGPDATPGVSVDGPPNAPLAGTLAPGATASGTYVFAVPVAARGSVTLTLNLLASQPTVVFTGAVG